jgi:hypothetical protein
MPFRLQSIWLQINCIRKFNKLTPFVFPPLCFAKRGLGIDVSLSIVLWQEKRAQVSPPFEGGETYTIISSIKK